MVTMLLLFTLLGIVVLPILLKTWNKILSYSNHAYRDSVPFFFVNLLFYGVLDFYLHPYLGIGEGMIERSELYYGLLLIGSSCVGYAFYMLFAGTFLVNSGTGMRVFFLFLISVVFIPSVRYLFSSKENDVWGSGWFFCSLAIWYWLGIAFRDRLSVSPDSRSSWDDWTPMDSLGFLGGLVSLYLVQSYRAWIGEASILTYIASIIWFLSVSITTAWVSHIWSGRDSSEHPVVLAGIGSGIAFFGVLPTDMPAFLYVLLGFFAGIVPGALYSVFRRVLPEPQHFLIFLGCCWGAVLGFLVSPIATGLDQELAIVLSEVGGRALSLLGISIYTMLVGLIGLGGKWFLERLGRG